MKQKIDFNYIENPEANASKIETPYCFHNCDVNRY